MNDVVVEITSWRTHARLDVLVGEFVKPILDYVEECLPRDVVRCFRLLTSIDGVKLTVGR